MNIEHILNQIPDIECFLTVDEMDESTLALVEKYPHLASVTKIGDSRKGHPLYCLKIGSGKKVALMYGCPHPNEPIGCMMLEHLSRILCENEDVLKEIDTTFYIIKAVDPDGLNLNKGWLKGPFTYENYAKNFFRPNSTAQVEWTFPIKYKGYEFNKPIPETQAVMKLMEEIKPDFVYTLHNASFGGVYWYVSHNRKDILDKLPASAARQELPLNLGEPECAWSVVFAPAIYEFLQATNDYDYFEETIGGDPYKFMHCGGSSMDYMKKVNPDAFILMTEEPYFYCADASDITPCDDMTRREAVLKGMDLREGIVDHTIEQYNILKKYADPTTMYMQALGMYASKDPNSKKAEIALMDARPEEFDVPASKASKFDGLISSPWYPLLGNGLLIGCAKETLETTNDPEIRKELEAIIENCSAFVENKCREIEAQIPCIPIPIKKLIAVQMESAFIVLEQIQAKGE